MAKFSCLSSYYKQTRFDIPGIPYFLLGKTVSYFQIRASKYLKTGLLPLYIFEPCAAVRTVIDIEPGAPQRNFFLRPVRTKNRTDRLFVKPNEYLVRAGELIPDAAAAELLHIIASLSSDNRNSSKIFEDYCAEILPVYSLYFEKHTFISDNQYSRIVIFHEQNPPSKLV